MNIGSNAMDLLLMKGNIPQGSMLTCNIGMLDNWAILGILKLSIFCNMIRLLIDPIPEYIKA